MIITIRPNLNNKDTCSIHEGRLGKVIAHRKYITFQCVGAVVRPSGAEAALSGFKYPHAGLIGFELDQFIEPNTNSQRIKYNPQNGDKAFHIDGKEIDFSKPLIVSAIAWQFHLIRIID